MIVNIISFDQATNTAVITIGLSKVTYTIVVPAGAATQQMVLNYLVNVATLINSGKTQAAATSAQTPDMSSYVGKAIPQ